jgi:hypothetical protein
MGYGPYSIYMFGGKGWGGGAVTPLSAPGRSGRLAKLSIQPTRSLDYLGLQMIETIEVPCMP